jgi:hypothetical protein
MVSIINNIAIQIFNLIALFRGYRFVEVKTARQAADFDSVYKDEGLHFPANLEEMVQAYQAGTVSFVAYCKGVPVGTVRLGDPRIRNRPFELFGLDEKGEHFEIQSLMVKKQFREGTQFVMMGLFKAMYVYSLRNSIRTWISGSTMRVYRAIRRYSPDIRILEKKCQDIDHPLTKYVYDNHIVEFYYSLKVSDISPVNTISRFLSQVAKQVSFTPVFGKVQLSRV